jgi:hypothetical protein
MIARKIGSAWKIHTKLLKLEKVTLIFITLLAARTNLFLELYFAADILKQ